MKRLFACGALILCAALLVFTLYVNVDTIAGTFGDGPPYYGLTTNMDKWKNPLPVLVTADAVVLLIVYLGGRWALRRLA